MTTSIDQALGEFIDAWKAGRRPNVDDYLMRVAEPERAELARDLSEWLEIAPTPGYDEATLSEIRREPVLMAALAAGTESDRPLAERVASLRERAGLAIREVAARVVERFSLGEAAGAEARTAVHLEELESGDLDPARVSRRLLDGLAEILGARSGALGGGFTAAAPGVVYQRSEEHAGDAFVEEIEALSDAAMAPAPKELDEVDRLFLGGPEG